MRKLLFVFVAFATTACASSPSKTDQFLDACWDIFSNLPVEEIRELCTP